MMTFRSRFERSKQGTIEMAVSDYRKQYEAELKQDGASRKEVAASESLASDKGADPSARAKAIETASVDPKNLDGSVGQLLRTVRDRGEDIAVRLAALRALGAAAFLGPRFAPYRADYLQAMRDIAEDPEPQLRENALEVLAIAKDSFAQQVLLRVLKGDIDLVPLAKAIQFLAYDIHSDLVPAIRDVFERATGAAKEEALRVLAIDPGSQGLFERLMKDKSQPSILRRLSASGLQAVNPEAFQKAASEIVSDDKEYKEIIATTLGALTHVQEAGKTLADSHLVGQIEKLRERTSSSQVKSAVKRFIEKTQK
jgi:hypothetical protein